MVNKEFNLSEKRFEFFNKYSYSEKDIKEFIKRLKDDDIENLAKWIHKAYETLSKINNWKTQEKCQVDFDDLPEANKKTMLQIAAHIITRNNIRLDKLAGDKLI